MIHSKNIRKRIVYEKVVPARQANYVDFPESLSPKITGFLTDELKIDQLYCHQAEMFTSVMEGKHTVITTSTASGKTLSFLLPVLQELIKHPQSRAIFIYPTKALASDQYRNLVPALRHFGENRLQAGIYDGDTPVSERSKIRANSNIILTNPEMINSAFLPHHSQYGFNFIFSNLRYIVIDELHAYRGAFGSHLANVFKRLNRICLYYGSSPLFLCSSATIANPVELAENICGHPFSLISNDGSPSPKKNYYFWQPPTAGDTEFRISPAREAVRLIPALVRSSRHFIAFCKSRNAVEIILKESRDRLKGHSAIRTERAQLIAGYRGGYQPGERREIEHRMVNNDLLGLIATNVLELGIDLGQLDTAVLVGYPGTKASFWQQSGRAGRKGMPATVFLMLDNLPMDQYLTIDPDWLFEGETEYAVVDKNNLYIQLAHVRAAAAELPLTLDDLKAFPDLGEIIPVLLDGEELQKNQGKYMWSGKAFPAGDFSLRNIDKTRFKLKNKIDGTLLTEMDELQAYREIYKGAVYLHEGRQFLVESLDTATGLAIAGPSDVNYYTVSGDQTEVIKIQEHRSAELGRTSLGFGDLRVAYTTFGFRRQQFHNHQNLGFEKLDRSLTKTIDTEGLWIRLPDNVYRVFAQLSPEKDLNTGMQFWKNYFEGLSYVLLNSCMMITMTTADDIGSSILIEPGQQPVFAVCIFDLYAGGLGFAAKACEKIPEIIANALKMVGGCSCEHGCPACVGDYHLNKQLVLWGLKNLFQETDPPADLPVLLELVTVPAEKLFHWESLADKWNEFVALMEEKQEYLAHFLSFVGRVEISQHHLVLYLNHAFLKEWLSDEMNLRNLKQLISDYCTVPLNFEIIPENESLQEEIMDPKLVKLYNDLIR